MKSTGPITMPKVDTNPKDGYSRDGIINIDDPYW